MYADVYNEVNYCITPIYHGHSPNIFIDSSTDNIRTDISLSDRHMVKIWGQFKNASQLPLYKAVVKLIELTCHNGQVAMHPIAETLTDPSGFYFFDVTIQTSCCYRIVVASRNAQNNKILVPHFSSCHLTNTLPHPCHKKIQASFSAPYQGGSYEYKI
ncbi:MAG: hypothetical protein ACRCW2_10555 [Cellulosilyticaceae bacterium]